MIALPDRVVGAILGLATGDALGAPFEFGPPLPPGRLRDVEGGGPHGVPAGSWTDDTSLALALAESLLASGGVDPWDQLDRYLAWLRTGRLSSTGYCFDVGTTTAEALRSFERTDNPSSGTRGEWTSGNGSLMRTAPVALYYANDPGTADVAAAACSRTTHAAVDAVDACRLLTGLVGGALRGVAKEDLLSPSFEPAPGVWSRAPFSPKIEEVRAGSYRELDPPEIEGTGYVVRSVEAALWAFHRSRSFDEACVAAVSLGRDADTTAAVCGALAGAYHGVEAIPRRWLDALAARDVVDGVARRLAHRAARVAVGRHGPPWTPSMELRAARVPADGSAWSAFALDFDAAEAFGDARDVTFVAESVRKEWNPARPLSARLPELRAALHVEARDSSGPGRRADDSFVRALLRAVRAQVARREGGVARYAGAS